MSGAQICEDLRALGQIFNVDLGFAASQKVEDGIDLSLFEQAVQNEAAEMAKYYQLFYCLEKSIRKLIAENLKEGAGANWWETDRVPIVIKDEVKKRQKAELDSGVTSRSDEEIDFTTFGELEVLITKNWDLFNVLFDSQRAVQRVMNSLNLLRGPIAHCCPYSQDEKERLKLTVRDWIRML
jgi:hypothetical protein